MVGPGKRLLDAGCGGGASLLAAERGAHVSGLDAANGLVAFAQERLPDGDFCVGDIENLPFDVHAFDAVFAANSVQYSADRVATLREFARVCVPGGRVVAGLFGPPENVKFSAIFKALVDALPEPPPGAGPFELSAPGVLEGLFEEAGLEVVQSSEADCPFNYPDFDTFWRANVSAGPSQSMLRSVGEEKLKSTVRDAVRPFSVNNGQISIQPNIFRYVVATV
jgi:SAM-dependent methyltransferase